MGLQLPLTGLSSAYYTTFFLSYRLQFTMSAYNDATSSDMNGIRQAGPAQDSKVVPPLSIQQSSADMFQ